MKRCSLLPWLCAPGKASSLVPGQQQESHQESGDLRCRECQPDPVDLEAPLQGPQEGQQEQQLPGQLHEDAGEHTLRGLQVGGDHGGQAAEHEARRHNPHGRNAEGQHLLRRMEQAQDLSGEEEQDQGPQAHQPGGQEHPIAERLP